MARTKGTREASAKRGIDMFVGLLGRGMKEGEESLLLEARKYLTFSIGVVSANSHH